MRILISCIILITAISCGRQDPMLQKEKLNGYWEIESVTLPDGSKKDFSFSTVVDFIEVSEEKGVRTKVMPQIDGSFINNGPTEKFAIKIEDNKLQLYYETPYDQWKETVITANGSALKVVNKDGKIYSYKKFEKFNFKE
jgi:hypothetical protein